MIKKILLTVVIFVIFILAVFVWQLGTSFKGGQKEVADLPQVGIGDNIFTVEIVDVAAERAQGLSGRQSLAEDRGMLFLFEMSVIQNFWMKGMNFPLDIIWINGDKIVGFAESVPPDNSQMPVVYSSPEPVDKVLEINAGSVNKLGIKKGDKIEL